MLIPRIPKVLRLPFKKVIWNFPEAQNTIYLTFDDGPTPQITEEVLDLLEQYEMKATFFLIGRNVEAHPDIADKISSAGHRIGQHTQNHLNAFRTKTKTYLEDVKKAETFIESNLFRPPYGRIRPSIIRALNERYKIVMWTIISADYDRDLTSEQVVRNVTKTLQSGDIVVFHDSEKAWPQLKEALPIILEFIRNKGFKTEVIPE